MATEVNEPGCSSSQSPSDNTLTRVTTVSSEAEDSGEDASKSSSRTSAGSAEPESLLSRLVFLTVLQAGFFLTVLQAFVCVFTVLKAVFCVFYCLHCFLLFLPSIMAYFWSIMKLFAEHNWHIL